MVKTVRFRLGREGYEFDCDDGPFADWLERWSSPLQGAADRTLRGEVRLHAPLGPTLRFRDEVLSELQAPEDAFPVLERYLYTRLAFTADVALLHGAVLAHGKRAVLFAGESGAGKSVLSLELCARGWTYLSDEFAPITSDGRVLAVPRPVSFAAGEIAPALLARLSKGRDAFELLLRGALGGPQRTWYVVPERRAPSGSAWELHAVYRLEARAGQRPVLHRVPGPRARAWLLAQRARAEQWAQSGSDEPWMSHDLP